MLTKKALAAAGHEQIPFLVSPPRRRLPSTPLDPLRAKAVNQSPQRSSTDRTKTTATVLYRLAMLETYEHPIILWRRVDLRLLHETGLFLPSLMLQKVSVLSLLAPISPDAPYSCPNECGCISFASLRIHSSSAVCLCSPASRYASKPLIGLLFLPSAGGDGPGMLSSPRGLDFHFRL
jgi:hypothetical protein